jgi:hypothetical protein
VFRLDFQASGADEIPYCFPDMDAAFERAMRLFARYCPGDARAKILNVSTGEERTFGCELWWVYAYLGNN